MSRINAKDEFIEHVIGEQILCAVIEHGGSEFTLKAGFDQAEFDEFLDSLDFEYDSGFGGQELYGTIWYTDGTWSERGEYDGSEWWEFRRCPPIPGDMLAVREGGAT